MGSPTQAFRYESEMLPLVFPELATVLGLRDSSLAYLPMPMIGNVIPDILIGSWSSAPSKSLTKLTYVDAAVFALLEACIELSESDILSRIFLPSITAAKTFSKLQKVGAVEQTKSGSFKVVESASTQEIEIVAVELKMKRWRDALKQAVTYKRFANRAYVILDENQVTVTSEMQVEFLSAGVGLLLQDGSKLQLVLHGDEETDFTPDRVIAAQKLTQMLIGFTSAHTVANAGTHFSK